jgi:hypothetical protein
MSVITNNTIQPSSGQALTIKDEGGTASITVQTDGDLTLAENAYLGSGKGIYFDGQTTSANFLDDYETGTWSPIITNGSHNATGYTNQDGSYTRIGKVVLIYFDIKVSNFGSISSGSVEIGGLPFNADGFSGTGYPQGVVDIFETALDLASNPCLQISSASSIVLLDNIGTTSAHTSVQYSDIDTGTTIRGQIFYHAT